MKKQKQDDPKQSEWFVKKATELADAGELDLTEPEGIFGRRFKKIAPQGRNLLPRLPFPMSPARFLFSDHALVPSLQFVRSH